MFGPHHCNVRQVDTKLASRKSSTEVRKTSTEVRKTSVPKKISTNLPIPDLSLVTARIDTEGTEVKLLLYEFLWRSVGKE